MMKVKYRIDYRLTGEIINMPVIYAILTTDATKADDYGVVGNYHYEDIFIAGRHYRRKLGRKSHHVEKAIDNIRKIIKIGFIVIPENWEITI